MSLELLFNVIIGLKVLLIENCNDIKIVMDYSYKIDESSKILLTGYVCN